MALTQIQYQTNYGNSYAPSIVMNAAPTPGNLLYAQVSIGFSSSFGKPDTTISMSGWTAGQQVANNNGVRVATFYKTAAAGEPSSWNATLGAARAWIIMVVEIHSTSSSGWVYDQHAFSAGTSASPVTGTTPTTTQAEEYWVGIVSLAGNLTLTSPTNSFIKRLETLTTEVGTAFLDRIVAATGTASTGGTYSQVAYYAAAVDAFKSVAQTVTAAGASLSGQGTLEAHGTYPTPTLVIAAAFGYTPRDSQPAWRLISSYVRSLTWQRGKQNELNQLQAGTATVVLNDPQSHFDPSNTSSPFYPNVKPGIPVRAALFVGPTMYPLFYGFADRLPRTDRVTTVYTQRQLELTDGFTLLAFAGLGGYSYPQQPSDQRVGKVLDDINWPTVRRRIGTGSATLQPVAFRPEDMTTAQAHLQAVDDSEDGILFVDGSNNVVFVGKGELTGSPWTTSQAVFGDSAAPVRTYAIVKSTYASYTALKAAVANYYVLAGGYPYVDLVPSYDLDNVVNRWTVTVPDGNPQTAEDIASQQQYFLRARQTAAVLSTDAQAYVLAQSKIAQFSQPLNRIESLTIMSLTDLTNTAQIAAGFARDLGDRITIREIPPGFTAVQSRQYIIQQINGTIEAGPLTSAKLTFSVWPA